MLGTHRDFAKAERLTQRNNRRQADRIADMRRAKDRADFRMRNRIGRDIARNGRFAAGFANRNFARVRFAGLSPERAWRRGLMAAFIPWAGAVYMPYVYNDMFDYTFWPTGYHDGYWANAYDDFFDGIWWAGEPTFVAEAQPYAPVSSGQRISGSGPVGNTGARTQEPDDRDGRVQAQSGQGVRVTASTAGEGACGETGRGITAWPFERIQSSLDLSDDQQDLLDELREAATQAAEAMRDSCPQGQPRNAVDRLQTMIERLEGTLEALKLVRPPLEAFYESLDDDQRESFQALGPKLGDADRPRDRRSKSDAACGKAKPGLANFPIERIQETVSLEDDQLDLLDALEDATFKALDIMKAACPDEPPFSPAERIKASQSSVEAMLRAAKVIQPALDDFYSALNDRQKVQFDSLKG